MKIKPASYLFAIVLFIAVAFAIQSQTNPPPVIPTPPSGFGVWWQWIVDHWAQIYLIILSIGRLFGAVKDGTSPTQALLTGRKVSKTPAPAFHAGCASMKKILFLILVPLAFCGCSSTNNGPMTHAAFRAAVTLGEQYAIESHPDAIPYLQAATPVVCAVANGTNVSAAQIVAALDAAGVTNKNTRTIVNGALAIFNVVVAKLGNSETNQSEIRLYGQDLCVGLTDGLPSTSISKRTVVLPPHLKN